MERRISVLLLLVVALAGGLSFFAPQTSAQTAQIVNAVDETDPVVGDCDSADDPAIWIHPTDPSQSLILGTDKKGFPTRDPNATECQAGSTISGGLEVYDLQGNTLQVIPGMPTGNVDLRYNFSLGGEKTAIAVATNEYLTPNIFRIYKINASTRRLEDVTAAEYRTPGKGVGMYVSPVSGKYYAFTSAQGRVQQWELKDNGAGKVAATMIREIALSTNAAEGIVIDDVHQVVYASEEGGGVRKFSAEPNGPTTATVWMDTVTATGGHLTPDVEGISIYYKSDGTGYILVSSQNSDAFDIYRREGDNAYIGRFHVGALAGTSDEVTHTDGFDLTNFPLGTAYPQGVFIAQDDRNSHPDAHKNYKLVRWQDIASKFNLSSDTSWDPRKVGGSGTSTTITPTNPTTGTPQPTNTQTPGIPGDANSDGKVDGIDYIAWLSKYGQNLSGRSNGDFNNDGKVDGIDYIIWLSNYGTSSSTSTPTHSPTVTPTRTVTVTPSPTPTTGGPTLPPPPSGLRAFPGAEGFGAIDTIGGRGGRVIYVTNLNDSGAGSLREALTASGSRTVMFKVGGTIDLNSPITISNPYLTIAGQTAPGQGVQLKGGYILVKTHDVIMRYMKIRSGDEEPPADNNDRDAITLAGQDGDVYNIVIDHSTLIWGPDMGAMAMFNNTHDVTVQDSIMGEGLRYSNHIEAVASQGGHSLALNLTVLSGTEGPNRISIYRNLLTTSDHRMPQIINGRNIDMVNNVVYNWGSRPAHGNPFSLNLIKNFFIKGPVTTNDLGWMPRANADFPLRNSTVYESGNAAEGFSTIRGGSSSIYVASRFTPYSITNELTPQLAYSHIVNEVGANKPVRDSVDQRIVNNLTTRSGGYLDGLCGHCTGTQISWPNLSSGTPPTDSDSDGMADSWEQTHFGSLSRGSSTNSSSDFDGDGYTDLEEYINSTDPKTDS